MTILREVQNLKALDTALQQLFSNFQSAVIQHAYRSQSAVGSSENLKSKSDHPLSLDSDAALHSAIELLPFT